MNLTILQHLEQLVHLDRMQFADLIQKQYAAMRAADRAGLRLRHALNAQRPGALVNRIMHATNQRVCYAAVLSSKNRPVSGAPPRREAGEASAAPHPFQPPPPAES